MGPTDDRSINSGFASLRQALPTCHPTDSKAVVLRKAVARIEQLEKLIGQEPRRNKNPRPSESPEMEYDHRGRYDDWEEPRVHGRPHSQSVSHGQPRRTHSHTHSHSESISYPRSSSGSAAGESKRPRDGPWDEQVGNRRRMS